jgi:hypothetical protein
MPNTCIPVIPPYPLRAFMVPHIAPKPSLVVPATMRGPKMTEDGSREVEVINLLASSFCPPLCKLNRDGTSALSLNASDAVGVVLGSTSAPAKDDAGCENVWFHDPPPRSEGTPNVSAPLVA